VCDATGRDLDRRDLVSVSVLEHVKTHLIASNLI